MQKTKRYLQKKTLLIVVEGDAEVHFLTRIKSLFISRDSGLSLAIKNAHGKGAKNVVEQAIRQSKNTAYDKVTVFFDTDTPCTDNAIRDAEKNSFEILQSNPCLEYILLRMFNHYVQENLSSAQLKKQFKATFSCEASHKKFYEQITITIVTDALNNLSVLNRLLKLLNTEK